MVLQERFLSKVWPEAFRWLNEPRRWRVGNGLEVHTDPTTDFWQRTHYGFRRDNGHGCFVTANGDFTLSCRVAAQPNSQYDQCGLMVRVDSENWIKTSTEFETASLSRLGSVVTNLGYSDWATQDVGSDHAEIGYRVSRRGSDFLIETALHDPAWRQLRVAHLHRAEADLEIGVYACSPKGEGFSCCFHSVDVSQP